MTIASPMLASPSVAVTVARSAGKTPRLWPPESAIESLGVKSSAEQLETWKGTETGGGLIVGGIAEDEARSGQGRGEAERVAVGRVDHEVGFVDVDADVAQAQREAFEDVGDRV